MLFDTHLHFSDENNNLNLSKIKTLIENAKKVGIERFISNSVDIKTINQDISLANEFKEVYIALGIYPGELRQKSDLTKINKLIELFNNLEPKIRRKAMIGEIGLDFKLEHNEEIQKEGFINQIRFAKEKNVFMQIHSRYAISQTLETLINENAKNVIMHWYTESKKYAKRATDNDYFITVGPSYLYNRDHVYNVIKDIDPKHILFETDYPVSFSNVIQEPKFIKDIAKQYSLDFEIEMEELEKIQEKSFKRIYTL